MIPERNKPEEAHDCQIEDPQESGSGKIQDTQLNLNF